MAKLGLWRTVRVVVELRTRNVTEKEFAGAVEDFVKFNGVAKTAAAARVLADVEAERTHITVKRWSRWWQGLTSRSHTNLPGCRERLRECWRHIEQQQDGERDHT